MSAPGVAKFLRDGSGKITGAVMEPDRLPAGVSLSAEGVQLTEPALTSILDTLARERPSLLVDALARVGLAVVR